MASTALAGAELLPTGLLVRSEEKRQVKANSVVKMLNDGHPDLYFCSETK